jgi:hypothetical protein
LLHALLCGLVVRVAGMFQNTEAFNQSLEKWDVRQTTDFRFMFDDAVKMNNQPKTLERMKRKA